MCCLYHGVKMNKKMGPMEWFSLLTEYHSSIPTTQGWWLITACNFSAQRSLPCLAALGICTHVQKYTQIHILSHKYNVREILFKSIRGEKKGNYTFSYINVKIETKFLMGTTV